MKLILIAAVVAAIVAALLFAVACSRAPSKAPPAPAAEDAPRPAAAPASPSTNNPADMGRELRMIMLTTPPSEFNVAPTAEFPVVYAVLMDWPLDEDGTASVFSASAGTASLYTTSAFGIIGGEAHESARAAAQSFVRAAGRYVAAAVPATEFPYPASDRVRFHLLTFDGVRVIDTGLAEVSDGSGTYADLFAHGQAVLTELRKIDQRQNR